LHPLVLEAAGHLISTLCHTGDHYDAERFARICYDSLTRPPLDPESHETAKARTNLVHVSYNMIIANGSDSADIEEAEIVVEKAVCILKELNGPANNDVIDDLEVLINIKYLKKDWGSEAKSILEDFLSDAVKVHGVDGIVTGHANDLLGRFHLKISETLSSDDKKKHPQLSDFHPKETLRINIRIFGPNHYLIIESCR
jgi:hypothetical protein